ncbi:hypothetical protein [Micromonospora taraxaci]|uniref:hypothetical protein n=1 Tax=Micromonospora taraxaci TaxID=1316803 RepID=UPI0033B51A36
MFQQRDGGAGRQVQEEQLALVEPPAVVRAGADRHQGQGRVEGEALNGPTNGDLVDAGEVVDPIHRQCVRPGAARDVAAVPLQLAEIATDGDQITVGRGGGDAGLADLTEGPGTQHPRFGELHQVMADSILLIMSTSCGASHSTARRFPVGCGNDSRRGAMIK